MEDISHIKSTLKHVTRIRKHYDEISRISGDKFNIFSIIKLTTNEVRVHSAFLAELLNPKGLHGQGEIFLELFIDNIGKIPFKCKNATVYIEKWIGNVDEDEETGGRIDIVIRDNNKSCIVIENKIHAKDGNKQLKRYYNYCQKGNFQNFRLFYLTLDGRAAPERSKMDADYLSISYQTDIIKWLDACRKEAINQPMLREGILHYINLIKNLTGQSNNDAMRDEIVNYLSESPKNLRTANTIEFYAKNAKHKIQWAFWKYLRKTLEEKGLKIKTPQEDEKTVTPEKTYKYYHENKKNYPSLWIEIYQKDNISIHWGAEIDENFYTGFTAEIDGTGGFSDNQIFTEYRKYLRQLDSNYSLSSKYWLGWKHSDPVLNFRKFNSEQIYNLADEKIMQATINSIVKVAILEIAEMKKYLNQQ